MYDYKEYISKIHPNHGKSNEFLRNYFKEHGDYYEPADDPSYLDIGGNFNINLDGMDCFIYVYEKDGNIPHFHIVGDNFETCLCILHPLYFDIHGNIDFLSDKQLEDLMNSFRKEEVKWWIVCRSWDGNNLQSQIKDINQINYLKLKGGNKDVLWSKYSKRRNNN